MLETALEQSIEWSLSNRWPQTQADKEANEEQLRESESHVRAFITRFKIELNQLMGDSRSLSSSCEQQFSFSNDDDDEEDDDDSSSDSLPLTEGVYKISEDTQPTTDEELLSQQTRGRRRQQLQHVVLLANRSRQVDSARCRKSADDGYRSLSRGSTAQSDGPRPAAECALRLDRHSASVLVQQLNDIKARVTDLVQELDQIVAGPQRPLDQDELEAYRRRRDALVLRVDQLIGSQQRSLFRSGPLHSSEVSSSSASSLSPPSDSRLGPVTKRADQKTRSSQATTRPGQLYEEQVHVIDYDFNRRARDLSEINKSGHRQQEAANQMPSSMKAAAMENKVVLEGPDGRVALVAPPQSTTMIELSAIMTDYEQQQRKLDSMKPETLSSLRPSLNSRTSSTVSSSSSSFI